MLPWLIKSIKVKLMCVASGKWRKNFRGDKIVKKFRKLESERRYTGKGAELIENFSYAEEQETV